MASSEDRYLALDQGGASSRVHLLDARGALLTSARRSITTRRPRSGWVEHDADEVVKSLEEAASEVLRSVGVREEGSIVAGLATQRSSVVCWDRTSGAALSPVLSWQDRRAADQIDDLTDHQTLIRRVTGLRLSPHYGASKLRWCLDNLPAVARAHREGRLAWGPLAGFLAFRLVEGNPHRIDPANASRTLLWNLHSMAWDPALLELFELPEGPLPRPAPSLGDLGPLRIASSVSLRLLTGDQSAALYAQGVPSPDSVHVNLGTGAFALRIVGGTPPDPGLLLTTIVHADAGGTIFAVEGTVNGAGSALTWARERLGLSEKEMVAELPGWLGDPHPPPLFLNGVSGLGSPYWLPHLESRFVGDGDTGRKMVAVAESIAFLLAANLDEMRRCAPSPDRIRATGGLSRLDGLCRRLADLTGLPVERSGDVEGTSRGIAALLAGCPSDWNQPRGAALFQPRPDPALRERHARWRLSMAEALR